MKKTAFIFIALSTLASAINYLAYPTLSRLLPNGQYVDITVSLSILTQISTFLSSLIAITIGLSKQPDEHNAKQTVNLLQAVLLRIFAAIALAFILAAPFLMPLINTPTGFAIPIGLMLLLSIPIAFVSGHLNGKGKLVPLGLVAVISASTQYIFATLSSLLFENGLLTLVSMSIAQIAAIIMIYAIFTKFGLPSLGTVISKIDVSAPHIRKLILFTFLSSIAVMVINLLQVADLLILKELQSTDAKFYTDIYVISRAIFFAGLIFIWPFLGRVNIGNKFSNRKLILELIAIFAMISLLACIGLIFLGDLMVLLLFGVNYSSNEILNVGILSIVYKFFLLVITAISLYFIVLRSYVAVYIALTSVAAILLSMIFISADTSAELSLTILSTAVGLVALGSLILAYRGALPDTSQAR